MPCHQPYFCYIFLLYALRFLRKLALLVSPILPKQFVWRTYFCCCGSVLFILLCSPRYVHLGQCSRRSSVSFWVAIHVISFLRCQYCGAGPLRFSCAAALLISCGRVFYSFLPWVGSVPLLLRCWLWAVTCLNCLLCFLSSVSCDVRLTLCLRIQL